MLISAILDQARRSNAMRLELWTGDTVASLDGVPAAIPERVSAEDILKFLGNIEPSAVRNLQRYGEFDAKWLDGDVGTFLHGHEDVRDGVSQLALAIRFDYPH